MEYFTGFGYLGLFLSAFLAATILPFSSEVVLSVLLVNGLSPVGLVTIATIGNVLGSLLNYALGYWLRLEKIKRYLKFSDDDLSRAKNRLTKYGLFSLLFAWVPIIGDPLTVIAGMLRIRLTWFFILVGTGKLLRYVVITYMVLQIET